MRTHQPIDIAFLVALAALLIFPAMESALAAPEADPPSAASAATTTPSTHAATLTLAAAADGVTLPVSQSRLITLERPASRVSIANPALADLVVINPREFYLLGKDIGRTNVLVWHRDERSATAIPVELTHDLEGLKAKLAVLVPGQRVEVRSARRSIVLSGSVPSATAMNAALRIAEGYLIQEAAGSGPEPRATSAAMTPPGQGGAVGSTGQVINLLEVAGAQQVMLEVRVAEVARSELKRLDPRFNAFGVDGKWAMGGVSGGATFPDALFGVDALRAPVLPGGGGSTTGPVVDEFSPSDLVIQDKGLFASYLSSSFAMNLVIDAAKENGLARILAEPTLTTLTGQEATFLSGGEFPIPVPRSLDNVTIEFKEFGIGLRMLPVVLSEGRINVKLDVSVSELSNATSVVLNPGRTSSTFVIPALTKRSASGTVELADGQTIGLAGLINDTTRSMVKKFPGLGSVPVLGALFRSQDFLKGQTELVILVTPRLAKPIDPKKVPLPTDAYRPPSDAEFYWMGRQQAAEEKRP